MDIKSTKELAGVLSSKFENNTETEEVYRYALYVRKSTDEEGKQDRSLEDQVTECKELYLREGLRVVKVFEESMSAKEPDIRPKFREMMNDLQAGKYEGVIAWHPNRLARNMKEAGEIIDLLDKHIIKDLKFVAYTHNNDSSGKMLLGITFVMSKQYSDHLSDSVLRGNRHQIEKGYYINKTKHGYKKDVNQHLRPDGKNFTLISEAFKMRLDGARLEDVAVFLNKNGYTRTNAKNGRVYSAHMQKEAVRRFMKDPVYAGVLVYGKQVVELQEAYDFVPVVSVEDFMKINQINSHSELIKMAKSYRKGDKVKANLLRGKVLCSECGEACQPGITSKKLKNETRKYFYYRCETEGCKYENKSTRAQVILKFVQKYLDGKPFSHPDAYKHYKEEMERVVRIRTRETTNELRSKRTELSKAESHLAEVKSAMVIEQDDVLKKLQREEFESTTDTIQRLTEDIESLDKKNKITKKAPLTYVDFLELFENMAKNIGKITKMEDLDTIIGKIFLNFSVSSKSVEEYTLCEPFASLERLESSKDSNCAPCGTMLERLWWIYIKKRRLCRRLLNLCKV